MAAPTDVRWSVGRIDELGALQERLDNDAITIAETWPTGADSQVVALVQAPVEMEGTIESAFPSGADHFDDERSAREAATALAAG